MDALQIVGAGGIGCAVGYALCGAGLPVTIVDVNQEKLAWGRGHGLSVDQRPARPARFVHFEDWTPPAGATVLLCTKCYANGAVLARVTAAHQVIPIQNGFEDTLEKLGHSVEGIASFVSECHPERTHTRVTRAGRLHLGWRRPPAAPDQNGHDGSVRRLATLLRPHASFQVRIVREILPFKHTKLMYNAAISPLAATAGLDNGQLLSVPRARTLFFELLRENYTILCRAGLRLERIGPFHPRSVDRILRFRPLARALAWIFYPSLRGTYCSMAADLTRGQTEIDNYNGYLIRLAGADPCPLNRRVFDLVGRMARDGLKPGVERLLEL